MAPGEQRLLEPAEVAAQGGSLGPRFQWLLAVCSGCRSGEGRRAENGVRHPLYTGMGPCKHLACLALVPALLQAGAGDKQARGVQSAPLKFPPGKARLDLGPGTGPVAA